MNPDSAMNESSNVVGTKDAIQFPFPRVRCFRTFDKRMKRVEHLEEVGFPRSVGSDQDVDAIAEIQLEIRKDAELMQ